RRAKNSRQRQAIPPYPLSPKSYLLLHLRLRLCRAGRPMDFIASQTFAPDAAADSVWEPPPFRPSRWLRGGHAQTLGGFYLPGQQYPYRATQHRVDLGDGDAIVLHDDRPDGWREDHPAVLLIHGLAGS